VVAIGERIKEARKNKKITQQELAQQLNISRSAISNWEVGRNYPDLDLIVQLSDILDISLDSLLREDQIMVKKISIEQRKGVLRKNILRIIIPLFLISLFATGYLLYQEVNSIHSFFSPSVNATIKLEEDNATWTPVIFEDEPLLNITGSFWNKEVVNHEASQSDVELRISEFSTGEIIYQLNLEVGHKYPLDKLNKNTDYLVEIKGTNGVYFIKFL